MNNLAFYATHNLARCPEPDDYCVWYARNGFPQLFDANIEFLSNGLRPVIRYMEHVPFPTDEHPEGIYGTITAPENTRINRSGWCWLDWRMEETWTHVRRQNERLKEALGDLNPLVQIMGFGLLNEENYRHPASQAPAFYTPTKLDEWGKRITDLYVEVWGAENVMVGIGQTHVVTMHAIRDRGIRWAWQDNTGKETAWSIWWKDGQGNLKMPVELRGEVAGFGEVSHEGIAVYWERHGIPAERLDELAETGHVWIIGNMAQNNLIRRSHSSYGQHFRDFEAKLRDDGTTERLYARLYGSNGGDGGPPDMVQVSYPSTASLYERREYTDADPWGPSGTAVKITTNPAGVSEGARLSVVGPIAQPDGRVLVDFNLGTATEIARRDLVDPERLEVCFEVQHHTIIGQVIAEDVEYMTKEEGEALARRITWIEEYLEDSTAPFKPFEE